MCQTEGIHYSMLFNFLNTSNIILDGTKDKLVKRLLKLKKLCENPQSVSGQLEAFLGPPGSSDLGTVPTVTQHYRNTFNGTDRFDTYLGHLPYNARIASINHLSLIGVIRMSLVNAYTLYCTIKRVEVDESPEGIKKFLKKVQKNLLL